MEAKCPSHLFIASYLSYSIFSSPIAPDNSQSPFLPLPLSSPHHSIAVHGLINGNERGVKEVKLLAVVSTSVSKGFLDNGVPKAIKGRNILGQRLRSGVFKETRYCS